MTNNNSDKVPRQGVLRAICRLSELVLPFIGYDFVGKRVLEIGATSEFKLKLIFPGAVYESISLEDGQTYHGNFMDLEVEPYDCIISFGVFEDFGIDRRVGLEGSQRGEYSNQERLEKLNSLTLSGGYNAHASQGADLLFSNQEIINSGFEIISRQSSVVSYVRGIVKKEDLTELVVMRKK